MPSVTLKPAVPKAARCPRGGRTARRKPFPRLRERVIPSRGGRSRADSTLLMPSGALLLLRRLRSHQLPQNASTALRVAYTSLTLLSRRTQTRP